MFGCDIVGEYRLAHDWLGLTPDELVALARAAIDAAYCPPALASDLHTELAAAHRAHLGLS